MTGNEIGVHVGHAAAVLGRVAGAAVRVVLPLLVMLLVLGGRLLRRTTVLVVTAARAHLAPHLGTAERPGAPRSTGAFVSPGQRVGPS